MTLPQFMAGGEELGKKAGVLDGIHGYFRSHATRLHRTCELFGLFSERLGDVLEIGPFFGYTPLLLRPQSSSYTVLEGNDPVVRPLEPLYERHKIALTYVDFFEMFGPTRSAPHQLPLADSSCDFISPSPGTRSRPSFFPDRRRKIFRGIPPFRAGAGTNPFCRAG
jgi:hypothetical protein